jgi:hypothetical protein
MEKRRKGAVLKHLWKGIFNRSGEVIILRTHATTERLAWVNFCHQISKRDEVHVSHVMAQFDGSRDNYEITKEVEFKETDGA